VLDVDGRYEDIHELADRRPGVGRQRLVGHRVIAVAVTTRRGDAPDRGVVVIELGRSLGAAVHPEHQIEVTLERTGQGKDHTTERARRGRHAELVPDDVDEVVID